MQIGPVLHKIELSREASLGMRLIVKGIVQCYTSQAKLVAKRQLPDRAGGALRDLLSFTKWRTYKLA